MLARGVHETILDAAAFAATRVIVSCDGNWGTLNAYAGRSSRAGRGGRRGALPLRQSRL